MITDYRGYFNGIIERAVKIEKVKRYEGCYIISLKSGNTLIIRHNTELRVWHREYNKSRKFELKGPALTFLNYIKLVTV